MKTETRNCQACKTDFVIEPDDFSFYETIHVPPPTWCPQCRLERRLAWQGYGVLYKRKCDFTGKDLISSHHPDSPHKVYSQEIWWSDAWDPKEYGKDYDFSRPFFEQFRELLEVVPFPSLYTAHTTMTNSEYCNAASELKNCYLCFRITGGEDSGYMNLAILPKGSFDLSFSNYSDLCYESIRLERCYQSFFSDGCEDCHNVWFSKDLVGCSDCIGCVNLRKKKYHIFNKPYSKEEYEKKIKEFDFGSRKSVREFKAKVDEFMLKQPRRQFHGRKNENTSGDYIFNSKNAKNCYMVRDTENLRYCQITKGGPVTNCYDYTLFGDKAEWIYESTWVGLGATNNKFSAWNYYASDIEACFGCHSSSNLFGCVGIRKGEYCIFNKQYSKEEYKEMVGKIKKQMMEIPYVDKLGREYRYGEQLPPEFSPWAYNESAGYDHFPFTKEEVLRKGFLWRDPDQKDYGDATIEVKDNIKEVDDSILKAILKCSDCGKNYQIIPMELQFYKRFSLPIPEYCPRCRDQKRIKSLNSMSIYTRRCNKCNKEIESSYAPDRPEIVYCEACYQAEVV